MKRNETKRNSIYFFPKRNVTFFFVFLPYRNLERNFLAKSGTLVLAAGRPLEPARKASKPSGRTLETAGWASEPAGRALEPSGRASEPAGRASEPSGRSSEPAGRAFEPAGRASEPATGYFTSDFF